MSEPLPRLSMPFALSVDALEAWLAGARAGDRKVFARGPAIPRAAPVWGRATELVDEGLIRTHHVRAGDEWEFLAVRQAPIDDAAGRQPVWTGFDAGRDPQADEDPDTLIMRALRRAANMTLPCPTNAELAEKCGLKDAAAASYRLRKLQGAGLIKVEAQGPNAPRVVTIVETRRRTAAGDGR